MKRDQALDHVKQLTMNDRNQTHGNPVRQFERAQRIKEAVGHRDHPGLTLAEIEAIEMICTKLSRWVSGQRGETTPEKWAEHPLDIVGYAAIAVEAIYVTATRPEVVEAPVAFDSTNRVVHTPEEPSPFVGVNQIPRRFAPNPRKVEPPPEGSAA